MKASKPIKRHQALQPLSRQHHFGLLFSWKIRKGLNEQISLERLKAYRDWFFEKEILAHFETEEKHIFPILGNENALVKRALNEHIRIKELFKAEIDLENSLKTLEKELQAHIRFEERILFNKIEEVANPEDLETIKKIHFHDNLQEDYHDPFWL